MLRPASFLLGILAGLTVMVACGRESSPASTATVLPSTSQPTSTESQAAAAPEPTVMPTHPPAQAEPSDAPSGQEAAEIRQIVAAYWAALNEYDVDHAVTMLEPGYRAQEEELIRSDIGRMKLFRVKLEVSEETPPALNADGDYETYLAVKTPVDNRRVLMVFRRVDGQWWIVFSSEVE